MDNYLITGGAGCLGSCFVNYMSAKYPESKFVIIDILDYCASLDNIDKNPNIEIVIGDYGNRELVAHVLRKFNISIVAHIAAFSHVENSFYNSIEFTKNNVLSTHMLLETLKIYNTDTGKLKKFLLTSTDEIYGPSHDDIMKIESDPCLATNPYSATKYSAECLVQAYRHSYRLPCLITRGNNFYGINQYPEKVISKFICDLLNGKKLTIQGDGSAKRDFIHVMDTCTALETVLLKGSTGEVYNISSDHKSEFSVMQLAEILIGLIRPGEKMEDHIEYVSQRLFQDQRYLISSAKLRKLGWVPVKTNFIKEIEKLIEWYKINKSRYGF